MTIYNEIEPFPAQWLRNLSDAGHIAKGVVDERSIADLQPEDLHGHTQAHFFAGLGAWSYALRLAGWPDDVPVWTGSCPCQPFSTAGKGEGTDDPRHLWPEWRRLIDAGRPAAIFGEQVASPAGRVWLASVRAELEDLGYGVGAADLCAAGVGAPHIRQRLFFGAVRLADTGGQRLEGVGLQLRKRAEGPEVSEAGRSSEGVRLADANGEHWRSMGANGKGWESGGCGEGGSGDPWTPCEYLPGRDGKARPAQPGTFPVAHGATARVGRLRAYGNAIVPHVAAAFIESFVDAITSQETP